MGEVGLKLVLGESRKLQEIEREKKVEQSKSFRLHLSLVASHLSRTADSDDEYAKQTSELCKAVQAQLIRSV